VAVQDQLDNLNRLKKQAEMGGGEAKIDAQHKRGKLTARERIELLFDKGTFNELGAFAAHRCRDFGLEKQRNAGDAVVTGSGLVNGRLVFAYSQDFTVLGGSISEVVGQKVAQVIDMAIRAGAPLIAINDSGGARIQEGVASLSGVGDILLRNTIASGVIPQISVVVGPSAGGAVYAPALTDFIFAVKGISQMYITGPDVIKAVTGEDISHEALGGAEIHAKKSGVAHFLCENEKECFEQIRELMGFLPQSNRNKPPRGKNKDNEERKTRDLRDIIPDNPKRAYDMKKVITEVADEKEFFEVHKHFAQNIIVGFVRMGGQPAGIVAQQPSHMAGVIDINASLKAARFIRFCDAFEIPLVSFVDVPGFMPGTDQEHSGIIKHGAKLIYAYAEATVPKITVITRKAYGGAYIVMSSKHLRGDINYAWPASEVAVMGAEGAVNIISRKAITESANPDETRQKLLDEYREHFANPYQAAQLGYIDDVIDPADTRSKIIKALRSLENKVLANPPKKHGNIPL
jgi:propionyl-CoA carboxylase beta chain